MENGVGNPLLVVKPFDAAQIIAVGNCESFLVLATERLRRIVMDQDGPDHCREDPALDFTRNLSFDHGVVCRRLKANDLLE